MKNQIVRQSVSALMAVAFLAGCSKGSTSYSLLTDEESYQQQAVLIPKKIDILWVVDNSGSMRTSQENLAANFQSFIQRFQNKNYDFRMAVTTTDAYHKQFNANSVLARIRDGGRFDHVAPMTGTYTTSSGVFVMTRDTPNLETVFNINIMQGIKGDGNERPLESFKQALLEPWNADFRREEAFLAIIAVTDEEDSSRSTAPGVSPAGPLYTPESYVAFLNDFTKFDTYGKNYSVNAISVNDAACRDSLRNGQSIATRLGKLTELTGGVKTSLCSNFGESLELISDSIIKLAAVFKLSREPDVSTLSVKVDGQIVPKDSSNGWSYNAADLTITFHGDSVPGADAKIEIDFYPASIKL